MDNKWLAILLMYMPDEHGLSRIPAYIEYPIVANSFDEALRTCELGISLSFKGYNPRIVGIVRKDVVRDRLNPYA